MPAPSWNLAITVFFLIGITFGYILQRDKIVATLLSCYVALIVTQAISGNVQEFFEGSKTFNQFWINLNTSSFSVRTFIFLGVIVLLSAKSGISAGKTKGLLSPIEVVIYSVLTTGLILGSIFYFMPAESRDAFSQNSKMAALIINNYIIWLILPVLLMIVSGFFKKGSSSD